VTGRRPNLFQVGAMKSGTSSLHVYLASHPEIFMCEPKEPCYFVELADLEWPARQTVERFGFWRSEAAYLELFADAGDARVLGESSTNYSKGPKIAGVPERMATFAPEARILYLMRDPVERTISHYWHAVRQRKEGRDLVTALAEEPHYREVSHYALQLRPYLELFGAERVHTLTLEALRGDPCRELRSVFIWLGVDPDFEPPDLAPRHVTPDDLERVRGRGRLERFRHSVLWNAVGRLMPAALRRWGRRLAAAPVERASEDRQRAAELLRPQQLEQTSELAELLGRDFSEWRTLHGG